MAYKQRKDGRYYSRVNIGRGDDGAIKYKYFYGKTQKEVREQERAFTADVTTYGQPLDNNKTTLQDWGYTHLFTNIKPNVQASTLENYVVIYSKHIKDNSIGKMAIKDIQQINVQNYFNEKKYLSKSMLKSLRYLIRTFFTSAISNNLIRVNPIIGIKLPISEVEKKEIQILSKEEQKAYVGALVGNQLRMLCLTALYTGMRQGELIALKWNNINMVNRLINVCESYKVVREFNEDGTSKLSLNKKLPKTTNGIRNISVPNFLINELKKHKLSSVINKDNLVFCTDAGLPLTDNNIIYRHTTNCKKANIRHVTFHALRHTFATRMIESGVDVKTVSETLGHKDILITLNTYVHSTQQTKNEAAEIMDNLHKSMFN